MFESWNLRDDGLHETMLHLDTPLDADGYFDRRCPRDDCEFTFKVVFQDFEQTSRKLPRPLGSYNRPPC